MFNPIQNLIDAIRLPFRKEKELYRSFYKILGFYPHNISPYRQAIMHKSLGVRGDSGRPLNNERLEFLGDAILDAVVGDIVYEHFPGKREGFLTNARSKMVQRETLGHLADKMGLTQLVKMSSQIYSHNNYIGGNAFEAMVGAIYLDRGYDLCMWFMKNRVFKHYMNIDKTAYKEVNFKSRILEWSQKTHSEVTFELVEETKEGASASPVFVSRILVDGEEFGQGRGYSKKESQQEAAKKALKRLNAKTASGQSRR